MGYLFYVIGASGSGKDSVMNFVRSKLNGAGNIFFAHRYITRPPDGKTENHIYLTPEEFSARVKANCFAMHWESHEHCYGIGKEINYWMYHGGTVVVNGSREYLPHAILKYKNIRPVLIKTSPHILLQRLRNRGRETEEEIIERINRTDKLASIDHHQILTIYNDGLLEDAGMQLFDVITKPSPDIFVDVLDHFNQSHEAT